MSEQTLQNASAPARRHMGLKASRTLANTAIYVFLIAISIIWLIPFVCILLQSFRVESTHQVGYVIPQKWNLVLCIVLSAFTTALSLVPTYITSMMVDEILPSRDMNKLLKVVIFLVVLYIVQYVVSGFRQYRLRLASDSIITGLKKDIFAKAQYLPMKFYDKTSTGAVINRVNSDTATVQQFILRITQEAIVQFFTLVGIIAADMSLNADDYRCGERLHIWRRIGLL